MRVRSAEGLLALRVFRKHLLKCGAQFPDVGRRRWRQPLALPGMGLIDIRRFSVATSFDSAGQLLVGDVWPEAEDELEVQLTDLVRVNALAVPARGPVKYRVLRSELRLLLSFLLDRPGRSLTMRTGDFKASAGHVKRFITESFGMGMLTAAVQSHYGWEPSERSLANFDVLPTRLADLYPSYGVRPDLLFDFNEGESQWRLAGEARGRSAKRPQGALISAEQRKRLEEIVAWSGRNDQHRVTMTWAYSGADQVQVDLFDIQRPPEVLPHAGASLAEIDLFSEEMLSIVEERAEGRAAALTAQLYDSAPEPDQARPIFGSNVRGDWVTADLLAPSDLHLLLGVLDQPLSPENIRTIRRGRDAPLPARERDPVQIAVLQRILIVIAREAPSPPDWAEIIDRLQ